ncbi:hypothetical protein Rvan_0504 [Rhodomicrobium vannielii ATCC 17100]|uniref:ABC transporter substrate-binding protein n=1 Tax=Rhodomicrobium vannielii (strain ATCC 17100 / DSM 162 / LMG 4299 / NCIMB 10020 / ATH 3.1.1) TaxID=648757 RepID=E3HYP5_RHOVT|nr:ABC transporter substrate-binding protein [Rhodomicrobium vannielii]ADP69786.1 hypothetical protein Rvan_0504 [Rhodomicrobium vannielii ATCC 17100]
MGVLTSASTILEDMAPPSALFGHAAEAVGAPKVWDFLGNVPVPLRHRIHDGVEARVIEHFAAGGRPLKCCFPHGRGGETPFDRLRFIRDLADYPNMIVSAEHGNIFNRRFQAEFVERGAFASCQPDGVADVFADCGLVDPKGFIGVYAVAPFVLLIDRTQIGSLPVPRRWADLMEPDYRGQVVFGGWKREDQRRYSAYNKFFLLAMAKEFGLDGVRRLVANVPGLMHSAQMPRLAGTDASMGGIYVLPWSMADMCPRRDRTQVVWPEDGALAYPLWLTVKAARANAVAPLVDYFHGDALARTLNANRYPALAPGVAPRLPPGARFKWIGWDFVRHRSTGEVIKAACRAFEAAQDAAAAARKEFLPCA